MKNNLLFSCQAQNFNEMASEIKDAVNGNLKKLVLCFLSLGIMLPAFAQHITMEDWRMHEGHKGIISQVLSHHGDPAAYNLMDIPGTGDQGWKKAPVDSKGMIQFGGATASKLKTSMQQVDFTYFETFVNVPQNTSVTDFKVSFNMVDDGARAYVFNSKYKTNGAYKGQIKFGESPVTADYREFIVPGERNRIVIVQFDDAGSGNNLKGAEVVVNGHALVVEPATLVEGKTFILENMANGKALSVDGYHIGKNGTKVVSQPKVEGNHHRHWKFVASGDGENMYYLVSVSPDTGESKYLEVGAGEVGRNNGMTQMWDFNGGSSSRYGANQVWIAHRNSDGGYSIISAHANGKGRYALTLNGDIKKNGGPISIHNNIGTANQKWKLIPVG